MWEIEGNPDLGNSIEVVEGRELAMMEPITTTPNHQITKCTPSDHGDDFDDHDDDHHGDEDDDDVADEKMVWIMMIMPVYVDAGCDSTQPTTGDDWQTHSSQRRGLES